MRDIWSRIRERYLGTWSILGQTKEVSVNAVRAKENSRQTLAKY